VRARVEGTLDGRRVGVFIEASTLDGSVLTGARAVVQLV
jgi:hypothetical protein